MEIDSLPYVDELPEGWKGTAEREVDREIFRSRIPPTEVDEEFRDAGASGTDDTLLAWEFKPTGEDTRSYTDASLKTKILIEYEYQRLVAMELHSQFGTSVLIGRAEEEEAHRNMMRQMLDAKRREVFDVNAERKTEQMKVDAKARVIEEQLKALASKNCNIQKLCEELQKIS